MNDEQKWLEFLAGPSNKPRLPAVYEECTITAADTETLQFKFAHFDVCPSLGVNKFLCICPRPDGSVYFTLEPFEGNKWKYKLLYRNFRDQIGVFDFEDISLTEGGTFKINAILDLTERMYRDF